MNRKNVYIDIKFGSTSHSTKEWCAIALAFDDSDKVFYFERSDFDYGKALYNDDKLEKSLLAYEIKEEIDFVNDKDDIRIIKTNSNKIVKEITKIIGEHCDYMTPLRFFHDMTAPESLDIPAMMWSVEKELMGSSIHIYNSYYSKNIELISLNSLMFINQATTKTNTLSFDEERKRKLEDYFNFMTNLIEEIRNDDECLSIAKVSSIKRIVKSMLNL